MKRFKVILLALALGAFSILTMAQWGPGGIPLDWRTYGIEWMEALKFTSPSSTSYMTMATDSLQLYSTTVGDADLYWVWYEADGTPHYMKLDDSSGRWVFGDNIQATNSYFSNSTITGQLSTPKIISASGADILYDPDFAGAGTNIFGETGDKDINYLNGRLQTNIITVDFTYVMGADDGYMFTMTANDTLKCPLVPLAGEVLFGKFTHASGGWIDGNGNTIDGDAVVATSEDDDPMIVWNATTSDWEIR